MSDAEAPQVDLSQIRGDYHFHMNYVNNAVTQTQKRVDKMWADLNDTGNEELGAMVARLSTLWSQLLRGANDKGTPRFDSNEYQDFLETALATKDVCDTLEAERGESGSCSWQDTPLEQFTEACRQLRGLCDDLEMMREQQP